MVLIPIKLLWSCPASACARTAVCVWPQNDWDQGKTLVTREFLQVFFFQPDQIPNLLHVPATHTAITARVWKWSCVISALLWGEGMLQVLFLAKFCCPGPSISKTYSTFLTHRSFLMLGNSTVMNAITALNPSLQREEFFPIGHECVTGTSHSKGELWI